MELKDLEQLAQNGGVDKNGYPTDVRKQGIAFTNDYDWDKEWEAFDPQEAMADAYVAGFALALKMLSTS